MRLRFEVVKKPDAIQLICDEDIPVEMMAIIRDRVWKEFSFAKLEDDAFDKMERYAEKVATELTEGDNPKFVCVAGEWYENCAPPPN